MATQDVRNPGLREALRRLLPMAQPAFERKQFGLPLWQEAKKDPAYPECVRIMKSDPVISNHLDVLVGTSQQQSRHETDNYIANFFERVFEGQIADYSERFDSVYMEFESFFFSNDLENEILSPLVNFSINTEVEIDLGNGVKITPLPADLRISFAEVMIGHGPSILPLLRSSSLLQSKHCLYSTIPEKKLIGEQKTEELGKPGVSHFAARENLEHSLTYLRLFQKGEIGSALVLERRKRWSPAFSGITWGPGSSSPPMTIGDIYEITGNQVDDLINHCRWCHEHLQTAPREIGIAVRRFNFSYERANREDELIDMMISLESIFLTGESGELGYRVAIRVAGLLGNTSKERQEIFAFISRAYKERNNIVHGRKAPEKVKVKGRAVIFNAFVSNVRDYLRRSIREVLHLGLYGNSLITELERRILVGPKKDEG